jgi:hypothetical protein
MKDISANGTNLARHAHDLLARHEHFRGRADLFEFECRDKVLVVRGSVPTFYLKQLLQNALKHLDGVREIDNRVCVFTPNGFGRPADDSP